VSFAGIKNASLGVLEVSTQISKEGLVGQEMCGRVRILMGNPERVMCETVRVNS
jgi:hypothetical protein